MWVSGKPLTCGRPGSRLEKDVFASVERDPALSDQFVADDLKLAVQFTMSRFSADKQVFFAVVGLNAVDVVDVFGPTLEHSADLPFSDQDVFRGIGIRCVAMGSANHLVAPAVHKCSAFPRSVFGTTGASFPQWCGTPSGGGDIGRFGSSSPASGQSSAGSRPSATGVRFLSSSASAT